jgi:hypothetical protein
MATFDGFLQDVREGLNTVAVTCTSHSCEVLLGYDQHEKSASGSHRAAWCSQELSSTDKLL